MMFIKVLKKKKGMLKRMNKESESLNKLTF